jgi:hypothetical protein
MKTSLGRQRPRGVQIGDSRGGQSNAPSPRPSPPKRGRGRRPARFFLPLPRSGRAIQTRPAVVPRGDGRPRSFDASARRSNRMFSGVFDVFTFAADLESPSKMAYGSTLKMDCIHPPTPLAIQVQCKCNPMKINRRCRAASHTPVIFRKPHR